MFLHLVPQTQRSIVCVVNDEDGCFQKQSNYFFKASETEEIALKGCSV